MTTLRRAVLAAPLLLLATTACETSPTASPADPAAWQASALGSGNGADRWIDERFYDLTDSNHRFACDAEGNFIDGHEGGELIRLRGGIYSRFVATGTPSGNTLVNYLTMPVGLAGTGEDSGEEFRVKETEHGNSTLTTYGAVNPYHQTLTLTGRETGRSLKLVFRGTFTVANEQIIVDREHASSECRIRPDGERP